MARIKGTTNLLEVDANLAARGILYDQNGNIISVLDRAAVPGAGQGGVPAMGRDRDTMRLLRADRLGTLESGCRRMLLNDNCEGATLNTQRWLSTLTTMTITQSATGIVLNGSAITTINTGALLTSRWRHMKNQRTALHFHTRARVTLVANQVGEWGFGDMAALSATTVQVENGAHWRFNSSGSVVPVAIFNSAEVTGADISGSLNSANYYDWHVITEADRVTFLCARSDTGAVVSEQVLRPPLTQQRIWSVTHVYTWLRVRNTGSAPASAGQLLVGDVEVDGLDMDHNQPWREQLAENTLAAGINPTTFAQASQWANSAAPANASLSNTVPSYTTLDGLFRFGAVATAVTDFSFFSFAVPAPFRLKIYGAHVSVWNEGAANAATPASTQLWGIGSNGASGNLATGGHIRRLLGMTSIPISAAIGAASSVELEIEFDVPIVTEPGLHVTVIMRVVAGAATASQFIAGAVKLKGVFE